MTKEEFANLKPGQRVYDKIKRILLIVDTVYPESRFNECAVRFIIQDSITIYDHSAHTLELNQ